MKKIINIFLIILFLFSFSSKEVLALNPNTSLIDVQAEGAVLIEENTGKILFEKNMNKKMYPASTTKIMTAILALEYGDLEEIVTVGREVEGIPDYSNKANLVVGQKIRLHELLYGLMLPSGNDAAKTVAVHIAKKVTNNWDLSQKQALKNFAELMSEKAKELGAKQTHFKNPHGFHEPEHFTTPLEMAIITKEAMKNDIFREIVSTPDRVYHNSKIPTKKKEDQKKWENTNFLIQQDNEYFYPYASGIKTGTTAAAGKCLVSSATKEDLNLIAVVLNSTNDSVWKDSTTLLSYGIENFENYILTETGGKVIGVKLENAELKDSNNIDIVAKSTLRRVVNKNNIVNVKKEISWENDVVHPTSNDGILKLSSAIKKGEKVGRVTYSLGGETLGESELTVTEDISRTFISQWLMYSILGMLALIILIMIKKVINKSNRRILLFKKEK